MDDVWTDVASVSDSETAEKNERAINLSGNEVNKDRNTFATRRNFTSLYCIAGVVLLTIVIAYIGYLCGFTVYYHTAFSLDDQDNTVVSVVSNFIDRFSIDRRTNYGNETINYLGNGKLSKNSSKSLPSVNMEGLWRGVEVIETATLAQSATMNKALVNIPTIYQVDDLFGNNTPNSVMNSDENSTTTILLSLPRYTRRILHFCNVSSAPFVFDEEYINDVLPSDPSSSYRQQFLYLGIANVTESATLLCHVVLQQVTSNNEVLVALILVVALFGYFTILSKDTDSASDLIDDGDFIIARRKPASCQDSPMTTTSEYSNGPSSDSSVYYSGVDIYTYYIGSSYTEDVRYSDMKRTTTAVSNQFTMRLRSRNK